MEGATAEPVTRALGLERSASSTEPSSVEASSQGREAVIQPGRCARFKEQRVLRQRREACRFLSVGGKCGASRKITHRDGVDDHQPADSRRTCELVSERDAEGRACVHSSHGNNSPTGEPELEDKIEQISD